MEAGNTDHGQRSKLRAKECVSFLCASRRPWRRLVFCFRPKENLKQICFVRRKKKFCRPPPNGVCGVCLFVGGDWPSFFFKRETRQRCCYRKRPSCRTCSVSLLVQWKLQCRVRIERGGLSWKRARPFPKRSTDREAYERSDHRARFH